jgi:hypothetical protein
MNTWKRLDLRKIDLHPNVDMLVALRMVPSNARAKYYSSEKYEIGHFGLDRDGKKLWWHHNTGTEDPARLKQHYDIWWCYVAPFDVI